MEDLSLTKILKRLEEINAWFDQQQDLDVEIGIQKVKEGMHLVKTSRQRLKQLENEFEEIKKELSQEE